MLTVEVRVGLSGTALSESGQSVCCQIYRPDVARELQARNKLAQTPVNTFRRDPRHATRTGRQHTAIRETPSTRWTRQYARRGALGPCHAKRWPATHKFGKALNVEQKRPKT